MRIVRLARDAVDDGVVALQRRVRGERVHDRRGRECHARRGAAEEPTGGGLPIGRGREREQREEGECDSAAHDSAPRHRAFADFVHHAPGVAALEEGRHDAHRAKEGTVLLVRPVEHCRGSDVSAR